jgi:hypothetical protein
MKEADEKRADTGEMMTEADRSLADEGGRNKHQDLVNGGTDMNDQQTKNNDEK